MRRFLRYFRARRFDDQLEAEMQTHLDERIDALIAAGATREEAQSQASREFGNRTLLAEKCRDQWAFTYVDEIAQDVRYAMRVLRRSPVFTLVAILSLALGIGANTIMITAIDRVLLRALPFPEANRLLAVWGRTQSNGTEHMHVSAADFYDWRSQTRAFNSLAAFASWPMNLTNVDEPRRLNTELVSANFFSILQIQPQLGRTFLPDEDEEQSRPVVVISNHLWRALGQPQVIGQQITLNGSEATVVGIMPPIFKFPTADVDAWVPLSLNAANRSNRAGRWLQVIGRLKTGSDIVTAQKEMDVIARRLATAYPLTNKAWGIFLVPLRDEIVGKTSSILWTLQAGTLLLLLITCANLANLLLAKSATRTREIGMRASLGAGRARIFRQLMVESLLLASLGGICGIAFAAGGITLLQSWDEMLLPRAAEISVNGPILPVAFAITLLTAIVFGLAPAWQASLGDLREQIASGTRSTCLHTRKRALLVGLEVAMAAVLLIGAGLLGDSLTRLLSTSPGLRIDHLLTLRLTLSHSQYASNSAQNAVFERILDRVKNLPGVISAAEISDTPLGGNNPTLEFIVEGKSQNPSDEPVRAGLRAISPGYLKTAGVARLKGREFTSADHAVTQPVAIINQTMARHYWQGADPVGRRIRLKEEKRWMTVAGVIADVKQMGLQREEGPVLYIPFAQKTQDWMAWSTLLVRTATEPTGLAPAVRKAIHDIDKNQPVAEVSTLEDLLSRATAIPRFMTTTIGVISAFSLLIAVIGVYGLLAYTLAQRVPELGIRLTLGASSVQISWLLLRETAVGVFAGLTSGLIIAWWLVRFLESQLFGVRPHDPTVFAAVAGFLVIASFVAIVDPARRAMTIHPATALRMD